MTATTRLLRGVTLAVLATIMLAGGSIHAATLYATGFNGPDGLATLYRIDPATGAAAAIGPIGFQRVSAIDFGPDGRLYGTGERNDGTNTNVLIVIDTATGVGKEIAPLGGIGPDRPVPDISFRPSDGRLYAYLDVPDVIATIEPATGVVTVLGPVGAGGGGGNATLFSRNVTLFVLDTAGATSMFRADQTTGALTTLAPITFVGFPVPLGVFRVAAGDLNVATGTIHVLVNDSGPGGPSYLGAFDPATATVRHIGPTNPELDGLAWQPDRCRGVLYGPAKSGGAAAPSTFYKIDPNTGIATPIGPVGFNAVSGIDVDPLSNRMYAVGSRPAGGADVLIQIDPSTGVGVEIGPLVNAGLGGAGGIFDLSFRSDGTLYLTAFDPPNTAIGLYTVSLASGLATPVGPTGTLAPGNGTAFSLSDVLYHSDDAGASGTLYTGDIAAGTSTARSGITYLGFPGGGNPRINAMDADPGTGAIWASVNAGGSGAGPNYVGVLDPRTGNVRHIGLTVNGLDGLAWRTECDDGDVCTQDECARCEDRALLGSVFAGADGLASLYRIDPASGAPALIGPIGFQRVSAMEFDDETGVLFATGERNDGTNVNVLLAIDPLTGAGNEIGPTGIAALPGGPTTEPDIALRTFDGQLYAYLDLGDGVAVLDKVTGAATFLGGSGVGGFGNGLDFTKPDGRLLLADGTNLDTLDQTTGAATVGPLLSYSGFPALGNPRVNALDHNCSGRMFASVRDGGGGAGTSYLGILQTTGVVSFIGSTIAGLDGLAWISSHGFCKNTFVDTDADTVCDANDCAPADPGAWAVPPTINTDRFPDKVNYTWTSLAPLAGPATVYDIVGDTLANLPVGPSGEASACGFGSTSISVSDPAVGAGFWVIVRGHNVCAAGSYGEERHNVPGPTFPPRVTTTCP